ncbi:hypothetical protein DFH08DRAFT_1012233 [Mycena albidolilacea]|uniref:Uncharacterized protein n=1 Tax=Mycena albidolilacea TaxID=1033008 RepID=A0AAD6ZWY9_9AGAR|nr:hypothetical protein DFH08DRAFT_1012233 [Mycena albidolilacea]
MSCPSFKLDDILGVLLVGTILSYLLLGVVTLQVGAVWCGEVGQAISLGMAVYTNLIIYFGHPERLAHPPNSLLASILLGGLVSFSGKPTPEHISLSLIAQLTRDPVQIFFAFRIYALSRSFWIPCICWALSLFRFVPPNVIMFAFGARGTGFELVQSWAPLFIVIWAASAANDLLIAGTNRGRDKFVSMETNFVWLAFFVVIPRLSTPVPLSELPSSQASMLHHAHSDFSLANFKSNKSGGNEQD